MRLFNLKDINLELVSTSDLERLQSAIAVELQERDMGKRYRLADIEQAWEDAFGTSSKAKNIFSV